MKRSNSDVERPWRERAAEVRAQLEEWRAVRALVRFFGIRGADVDDVAQEVATALHRKALSEPSGSDATTRPALDRRALVWGVARRTALNHRRRCARRGRALEEAMLLLVIAAEPTPEDRAIAREVAAHVERAIETLRTAKPSLHEVLLRHLDEETVPAIAKAIGVPEGTAHTRLRLARKALDAMVQRQTAEQNGRAQRARLKTGARRRWS